MELKLKIFENIHFASFQIDGNEISTYSSWTKYEEKDGKVLFYNDAGNCQGFVKNAIIEKYGGHKIEVNDNEKLEELAKTAKEGDSYMSKNGLWRFKCGKWRNVWVRVHGMQMTEESAKQFLEMLERKKKEDEIEPPFRHGWRGE